MASEAAVAAAQPPVSAQVVGNAFVQQYYHILHHSPELVHRFYQDISKLGRPEKDGTSSITTTMEAINEKIVSLNYGDFSAEIKSVDAQESLNGGVQLLVTGYLTGKDDEVRNFTQSFFLAPQDKGYFVLNDLFRYVDSVNLSPAGTNIVVPVTPESIPALPVPEDHVSEQSITTTEEAIAGEVYNPPEVEVVTVIEEVPIAEVVDEIDEVKQTVAEPSAKIEEAPKKSYASIVMHLKNTNATFTPPPSAVRRAPPKKIVQVAPAIIATNEGPVSGTEPIDNENGQEGEADGHSIYIKGLPMNATNSMLDEVFKEFGTIKVDGIQVRSNRGFCFGFVEYEDANSVQKALEASPVMIGGRQAFVEEKKSTNSRGNNRGRFQSGRGGSGFRNEGPRGRGNFGGGRSYNRGGDFNGKDEFGGGSRGGRSSNRDGYQRSDNFNNSNGGGRVNRTGAVANGGVKSTPRVSATA